MLICFHLQDCTCLQMMYYSIKSLTLSRTLCQSKSILIPFGNGHNRMLSLYINPTKCKFMMILRKKNSLLPPVPLHLGGQLLECVNSYKYLGVHLSSDLSWSNHTQHVCVKAKKLIGLIFYNHIPQNMLLKLYKSLVQYGVLTVRQKTLGKS